MIGAVEQRKRIRKRSEDSKYKQLLITFTVKKGISCRGYGSSESLLEEITKA